MGNKAFCIEVKGNEDGKETFLEFPYKGHPFPPMKGIEVYLYLKMEPMLQKGGHPLSFRSKARFHGSVRSRERQNPCWGKTCVLTMPKGASLCVMCLPPVCGRR